MTGRFSNAFSGRRKALLLGGGLLALVLAAAAGVYWLVEGRFRGEGETNPTYIRTSISEGQTATSTGPEIVSPAGEVASSEGEETLLIRLSQGQAIYQGLQIQPVAAGEPLTEGEIAAILARLPELEVEPGDQVDFRLPEESLPAPRPGETIEQPFPPPPIVVPPETVEAGPLEVLRYAPEGEIPLAPFVNVTFNQPMVALDTVESLSAGQVPVQIDPPLPGTWRWLGTKTLSFEHDSEQIDRLPMATEYRVTIPAGTRSATGGVLAQAVSFAFSTPPARLLNYAPSYSPQALDPVFVLVFDQRVDPAAVLATVQVTADGEPLNLRLATDEELAADEAAQRVANRAQEARWLAFVAQRSLPADAQILVTVGPNTPSAEGPLLTREAQTYDFYTYAPLRIENHGCSWYGDECYPLVPFFIQFNNPIDAELYQESMITIEPELPGATVDVVDRTITIRGATVGRTSYRVTVSREITDIFGQSLGADQSLVFKVGPADPFLTGPEEALVTLDPASQTPAFTVYAINYSRLKVRAYRVEPSDWEAYLEYRRDYYRDDSPPDPPGEKVMDKTITLEAADDALTEANIDLSEALENGLGQLVVVVEPAGLQIGERDRYGRVAQAWVQVTQIGLDALADNDELLVWASALQDGAPLGGVTLQADTGKEIAVTGADGTVRFVMPDYAINMLIARQGDDLAILPKSTYYWGGDSWTRRSTSDALRWYIFDDRAMYRPGEEVHVKGWLRRVGAGPQGDLGLATGISGLDYTVNDPRGNQLLTGRAEVSALGGFDFSFTIPQEANLGHANIVLQAAGDLGGLSDSQSWHNFQIQEFRRPEFEVTARNESAGPYFVGDQATVAVEAAYYAGGALPNAEVTWQVSSSPASYAPPNWPDFIFGTWEPWWYWHGPIYYEEEAYFGPYPYYDQPAPVETFYGTTDASGEHYLQIDFEEAQGLRPFSVMAEATVMDLNRQAWSAATSLLVHPADLYVGLRSERTFVQRGQPLDIQLIVTDLDGSPVPDQPLRVTAARMEWKYRQGSWREEAVDTQECVVASGLEPVSCSFETEMGGEYLITAHVTDALGRENQSQFTRWVSGGKRPPAREVEMEEVMLIPDKESYQPGDIAEILVQAPFAPAEGLLTVGRSGFLSTRRFQMEEESTTLRVPIEEAHIPNLVIQVDLVGAAPRTDDQGEPMEGVPDRPAYASGQLELSIPPVQRTLSLQLQPREKELEPGGETTLDLVLTDAQGRPVPDAELAVVVVDEAILALTNYQLGDPVSLFYQNRGLDVQSLYGRASIVLANPEALAAEAGMDRNAAKGLPQPTAMPAYAEQVVEESEVMALAPAAAMDAGAAMEGEMAAEPIRVRADFNPLATFAPAVRTGADGTAAVPVSLPDNLTRYRIMVVAVSGGREFGSAEANLTARLPLMVRPSAPRFLNFGDQFELPVLLQNQTDEPMTVEVAVQAGNLQLTETAGRRVTVPARDRVELRFPATTVMPGTARLQIAAVSGRFADAATVELPVYTPATTEAFATYGVLDEGAVAQPVASPEEVYSQFGGLEINTSSTALQALTDAVLYLVSYRFECSEQLASRVLAVSALREVLTAFSAEGLPSPEEMEAAVRRDIARLEGLQNPDGGFAYWEYGRDSIPFNTIHVAHALQRAQEMGFEVPAEMRARTLEYLQNIESHYPHWYGERIRQTLSAYALYVRDRMGDPDPVKARNLYQQAGLEELSLEAVAWLWQVMLDDPSSTAQVDAIRRHINNRAVETAGAANFSVSYGDQAYLLLHSNRRTDAVILDALIADSPQSDLIPKVVNGLLAHRTAGRWNSTQENVFVLLALDRYFRTFEAETPEFVARIWLGDTYVGAHSFVGRSTERIETEVPMVFLTDPALGGGETRDLIISKEGPGRLYYRLGLRYAPTDLWLDPLDMGFVVQRTYEGVDNPGDVTRDEEGVWHIKAGARVRVKLTMVADNRRYHVALVDPLPAGLEIVNPALAVSGQVPQDPDSSSYRYGWWWWGTWYEHQNMRDERAEAFSTLVWEGVYHYSYVARATTPGTFVVPPAKAEEMYSPEVFGRSGSDWVIVE